MQLLARGFALFLGAFALANLLGGLVSADFDANYTWIDLARLAPAARALLVLTSGATLVAFAVWPARSGRRRAWTAAALLALALLCLRDAWAVRALERAGRVESAALTSLSLCFGLALLASGLAALRRPVPRRGATLVVPAVAATCAALFALGQMHCFGRTDYRRPADAILVFGARAYADGRPSDALADRVRTAAALYREGLAPLVVMSGGPGDGAVHETEAMRDMAVGLGVPTEAIVLDRGGLGTRESVRNADALLRERGVERVLAVSHAYHLPRVQLAFARRGREVYTVPARESYRLTKMPLLMAREVAALGVYWLRPLAESGA